MCRDPRQSTWHPTSAPDHAAHAMGRFAGRTCGRACAWRPARRRVYTAVGIPYGAYMVHGARSSPVAVSVARRRTATATRPATASARRARAACGGSSRHQYIYDTAVHHTRRPVPKTRSSAVPAFGSRIENASSFQNRGAPPCAKPKRAIGVLCGVSCGLPCAGPGALAARVGCRRRRIEREVIGLQ